MTETLTQVVEEGNAMVDKLGELYQLILSEPVHEKGPRSREYWPWWKTSAGGEILNQIGVYILWMTAEGPRGNERPFYVGEGKIGHRITEHFNHEKGPFWSHGQCIVHRLTSYGHAPTWEAEAWRKSLEGLLTLQLKPFWLDREPADWRRLFQVEIPRMKASGVMASPQELLELLKEGKL